MDSLTFTINLKDLNNPDNEDELKSIVGDMQLLIKFLMNANPNYYLIGNMLNDQLDEQMKQVKKEVVDPKIQMQEYLDSIEPDIIDGCIPDLNALYCNLRKNIGEAMGPVSYAAYSLVSKLEELGQSSKWVWDFVKYYEKNWKF